MPNLRKYAQQTQNRLVLGLLILVFTLGLGLIYFLYGSRAALLGLLCLLGILITILIILLILNLIERSMKNDRR